MNNYQKIAEKIKAFHDFMALNQQELSSQLHNPESKKALETSIRTIHKFSADIQEFVLKDSFDFYPQKMIRRYMPGQRKNDNSNQIMADDNINSNHATITETISAYDKKKFHKYSRPFISSKELFCNDLYRKVLNKIESILTPCDKDNETIKKVRTDIGELKELVKPNLSPSFINCNQL